MKRARIPSKVIADVITAARRRCCICFALDNDSNEKAGQIAHLDHDAANAKADNLIFLCLKHHDQYDSRTSQSKGLTVEEVRAYRGQLATFVSETLPRSSADIAKALVRALDRPAFRTPFHSESSLPRFRDAIAETIATINTGKTPHGIQLPSKTEVRDRTVRAKLEAVVEQLAGLRATFDRLVRSGEIRHCGCANAECGTYMFSSRAAHEMDRQRHELLDLAHQIDPAAPGRFYDI
jgi:hypothetical protein